MDAARRYLHLGALALTALIALAVLISFIVDPYRVYGIEIPGFNEIKPRAGQQGRLMKAVGLARERPATVLIGNSRLEVGIDPQSREWPQATAPVFNASLPGAGIGSGVRYLQHALAVSDVRTVVIGLEFLDFLVEPYGPTPQPLREVRPVDMLDMRTRVTGFADTLLSLDAVYDAGVTVVVQRNPYAPNLTRQGFNPLKDYIEIARREGYGVLFRQRDEENARSYANKPKSIFVRDANDSGDWQNLRKILQLCRERNIQVVFVIYPYHAHTLTLFHLTGLWDAFEDWKRHLIEVIDEHHARQEGHAFPVWDFSGYHRYAVEHVPAIGDRSTVVEWYWEAGHFKRELGDKILARVFGRGDADFGSRVQRSDLELHLAEIRRGRDAYERSNPVRVDALRLMTTKARQSSR